MDVFETVRTVLAVRAYQDKPIPADVVRRIVESAWLTASSRNGQPWHFIVVENRETLKKLGALARTGAYIAQAPVAIVVAMEQVAIRRVRRQPRHPVDDPDGLVRRGRFELGRLPEPERDQASPGDPGGG